MKIECLREKIFNTVSAISRLVGKNLSLPILSSVLLEGRENKLVFRATNLDIGAEISVPAKVITAGKIALPAGLLVNFLSGIGGAGLVELEEVNGNLKISAGRHRTTIKGLSADDFPTLPRIEEGSIASFESAPVASGIRAVVYAASPSEMKPEIASVYVYIDAGELVFVATDSFRLAEKRLPAKSGEDIPKLLVPAKNALEISRLLEARDGQISLIATKNQIALSGENLYITSRLIEGVFPDYQQIMPKNKTTEVVVLKEDFLGAMKVASLFADKFFQVRFTVDPAAQKFVVHAEGESTGVHETELDATLEGEAIEMNFNARYVLDAFNSITGDSITLSFNGKGKPMVMRGVGEGSFTYLAMPLNR